MADMARSRPTTTALLERLVGFDTTSRNNNLPPIEFVRAYLDGFRVPLSIDNFLVSQPTNQQRPLRHRRRAKQ